MPPKKLKRARGKGVKEVYNYIKKGVNTISDEIVPLVQKGQ